MFGGTGFVTPATERPAGTIQGSCMTDSGDRLVSRDGHSVPLARRTAVLGADALEISTVPGATGAYSYDPGFASTSSCTSRITYVDGLKGVLLYRGYAADDLARHSNFAEVSWLLLNGELPSQGELESFSGELRALRACSPEILETIAAMPASAHPMSVLTAALSVMPAAYPDCTNPGDADHRRRFSHRAIANVPTVAAAAYRNSIGKPALAPRDDLGHAANLLYMMFGEEPNPVAARALDTLLVLHADHEQNCSTSTVRIAGSSGVNPFSALAAGCIALWGPAHGGANEAVVRMLDEIGSSENIGRFVKRAKDPDDSFRLMGFGHRVYKNFDPRATIIRGICHEVLQELSTGKGRLFTLARELEEIALSDKFFRDRRLYPNVDFYSGIIYRALGLPATMFTPMFAVGRTAGWAAHWCEMHEDPEARIGRPRQLYLGPEPREYAPIENR